MLAMKPKIKMNIFIKCEHSFTLRIIEDTEGTKISIIAHINYHMS